MHSKVLSSADHWLY